MKRPIFQLLARGILPAAAALMLMPALPHTAGAQNNPDTPTMDRQAPAPQQQAPVDLTVTGDRLDAFASTNRQIKSIVLHYNNNVPAPADEAQRRAIQAKMNQEVMGAVQGNGLTVGEYNRIASAIKRSPELKRQYESRMR